MEVTIVGVDCATALNKVGLATALWDGTCLRDPRVVQLSGRSGIQETPSRLASEIASLVPSGSVLLAIDAPLGWPEAMHGGLPTRAGEAFREKNADRLFRRETDRVVEARLGRRVLEVGANLIARTAFVALRMLEELRLPEGDWDVVDGPDDVTSTGRHSIEVYPVGTALMVLPEDQRDMLKGYKSDATRRRKLLCALIDIEPVFAGLEAESDHDLDALLALLAATRFLSGASPAPATGEERRLARVEGWI